MDGEQTNQQQAGNQQQQNQQAAQTNQQQNTQQVQIDYDKIASLVAGKQQVAEDTVLKNYFKQQGLSQEEATKAIELFKAEKAKNQPDVIAIQTEMDEYKKAAQLANIQQKATLEAIAQGLDTKTVPYVLKMADFSNVVDANGNLKDENIKAAIAKVVEDVPALKPSAQEQSGFQIGSSGTEQGNNQTQEDVLKGVFGIK